MNILKTRDTFACIAEAVAYYYREGYQTEREYDDGRFMIAGKRAVRIESLGLLHVHVTHFESDYPSNSWCVVAS